VRLPCLPLLEDPPDAEREPLDPLELILEAEDEEETEAEFNSIP
jgi:hypothetical protein